MNDSERLEAQGSIRVVVLGPADAGVLERVADGVFDHAIRPEQAAAFLDDPRHQLVVAVSDGVVVGMVSAVEYFHPDKPPALWINEVGVAPTHHRRGIGRRLMERMLEVARERGWDPVWVGTEIDNVAARGLYEATGAKVVCDRYVEYEWNPDGDKV